MENLPSEGGDVSSTRDIEKHDEFENVANPQAPGDKTGDIGEDGRNIRGFGSTDQDSENGLLRLNDQDTSTMEVTPEAEKSISGDKALTQTSTVAFTTAGPDDDSSVDEVAVPTAEEAAKEAAEATDEAENDVDEANTRTGSQEKRDEDIAETGTSLDNQPAY